MAQDQRWDSLYFFWSGGKNTSCFTWFCTGIILGQRVERFA
jgi:hypothetical protein